MDSAATTLLRDHGIAIEQAMYRASVPLAARPDVRQEVAIRVLRWFRRHGGIDARAHPRTWLYRVALNTTNQYRRTHGLWPMRGVECDVPCMAPWPDALAHRHVMREHLRNAVSRLPPQSRDVVELRMQDMSFAEVAEATGRGSVRCRVVYHEAVRLLRKRLA